MLAVAQKNFSLRQGDLPFRLINVIAKTVGNVGELVVRQRIARALATENFASWAATTGSRRAASNSSRLLRTPPGIPNKETQVVPPQVSGSGGLFRMSDTRDDSLALVELETKEELSWNSGWKE
jgi:hypothetical protein